MAKEEKTKPGENPVYMGPEDGPFKCSNCEYYEKPNKCYKEEMIDHQGRVSHALVDPGGCCNYYEKAGNDNK